MMYNEVIKFIHFLLSVQQYTNLYIINYILATKECF